MAYHWIKFSHVRINLLKHHPNKMEEKLSNLIKIRDPLVQAGGFYFDLAEKRVILS